MAKEPKQEGVPVPTVVVSVIVVFVAGLIIGKYTLGKSKKCGAADCPTPAQQVQRYRIYPRGTNPSVGPMDARVTIVEVTDFSCIPCRRMASDLKRLQKKYPKDVRLVFMNNPSFQNVNGKLAAVGGLSAKNQNKFWEYHDEVFANQRKITEPDLVNYAQKVGLNVEKFKTDLKDNRLNQMVAMDQRQARMLGIRKMPAVFVNGRHFAANVTFDALEKVVKEEMKEADKLLAQMSKSGAAGGRAGRGRRHMVYREFMRNALSSLTGGGPQRPDRPRPQRPQEDPKAVYRVPIEGKPWKGAENALVTMVVVSEFQCPFSNRVNPTVKQIMEAYKGKVKYIWLNNPLPFHKEAGMAAEAAMEVFAQKGNKGFWEFHDKLFAGQQTIRSEKQAFIEKTAASMGVNMAKLKEAIEKGKHKAEIAKDQTLARSLGAMGTPTFFINGRKLRGARPFPAFKALIDEEVTKAEATIKQGKATPATYYASIQKTALNRVKYLPGSGPSAQRPPRKIVDPTVVYKMPVEGKPWKGAEHALVTIVESSEFQCPFCNRVNPTLAQILEAYKGKVKIVFHHNPLGFHPQAMNAAIASHEAFVQKGSKGFWTFHDKVFADQQALRRDGRAFLEKVAGEVGLNMAKFKEALDKQTHKTLMEEQRKLSEKLGSRGTPGFFINGKIFSGARPFEQFKQKIDEELKKAEALVGKAGGIKKLYNYIIKDGKTEAVYKEMGGPTGPRPLGIRGGRPMRPGQPMNRPRFNIRKVPGGAQPRPKARP